MEQTGTPPAQLRKPPYKGKHNIWFTASLFWETWKARNSQHRSCDPVFTLYDDHQPGLICFRTTFVEIGDTTGYKWAMKYLGDWQHWQKLMVYPWFREAYDHAVRELYTKLRSEGVDKIREIANAPDSKSALPAARYLAELEANLNKGGRGRPSKEEVSAELKNAAKLIEAEDEDMERIGLKVINGGKSGN